MDCKQLNVSWSWLVLVLLLLGRSVGSFVCSVPCLNVSVSSVWIISLKVYAGVQVIAPLTTRSVPVLHHSDDLLTQSVEIALLANTSHALPILLPCISCLVGSTNLELPLLRARGLCRLGLDCGPVCWAQGGIYGS